MLVPKSRRLAGRGANISFDTIKFAKSQTYPLSMIRVPASPATLAVLIGVTEVFILETFRFLLGRALAARRSVALSRFGKLHLLSASRQKDRLQVYISVVSILTVVVLIVLELSIDGIVMRDTGSRVRAMCYAPDRLTRYFGGFGPSPSEADDKRFEAYLEQTGCSNSLLSTVLSGTSGLQIGYPGCTAPFDEPKQRTFVSEFQGCGVGVVGDSAAGDFHCDVLPVGIGNQSALAGTSFLAVFESGDNSTSSFAFDADSDQRYLSNSRIPRSWFVNSTDQSVSVECRDLSLDCYILSRERAKTVSKYVFESSAPAGVCIQVLQNGNSSVCLFENGMRSRAEWVEVDQSLPGADERTRRNGPVLTGFEVSGEARCVENLDSLTARLHYDATEFARSPLEGRLLNWLQRNVVGTGIKTPFEDSRSCEVVELVEGSSISLGWFITACILSTVLVIVSVGALVYIVWVKFWKKLRVDPLMPLWSIRELLRVRSAAQREIGGDVFVGVVERNGVARFEVFENDRCEVVRSSKKPFL